MIGEAPAFLAFMDAVSRVAPLDRPVLVVGERGTGKELVAARLHFLSQRWGAPLIKLNAAAIPETLLQSELFGHEPGAFTGAVGRKPGRFRLADGGTLFLDEIASLSLAAQEKLLRVIEYGEFEPLGGSETVRVDVRVVGATNLDLPGEAAAGRFREDLLDRLAFDVLTAPPLRARVGDIALLATRFGRAMAIELGWPGFPGFTKAALSALEGHRWPGNVRELRNVVERAVYQAGASAEPIGEIAFDPFESPYRPAATADSAGAVPDPGRSAAAIDEAPHPHPADLDGAVTAFERQLIERALKEHRYNQARAARSLGLSYDQLRGRLRKHGLSAPR